MSINIADNMGYNGKKPLDNRTQYSTLALMKTVTDANINEGCLAYCAETDKYYKFLSTNTVDETTGKWREFSSGGGGASDYSDLTNKPSIEGVTLSGNKTASDLGLAKSTDIPSTSDCYKTGDTAFTALADADYVPVYDTSASAKKKTLWSNIKSVLKTYFDTLYVGTAGTGLSKSSSTMSIKSFASGDMDEVIPELPSVGARYHQYSTEEQVVGRWIDGSILYERCIEITMPTVTTQGTMVGISIDISSWNIKEVVSIDGCFHKDNTSVQAIPLNSVNMINTNMYGVRIYVNSTNTLTVDSNYTTYNGRKGIAIVKYTKAT